MCQKLSYFIQNIKKKYFVTFHKYRTIYICTTRIDTRNSITSYQNGEECFCGDYLTKSYKKSDSECKMACKGKRAQACGGTWRVLIYRNPYYRCKLFSQPTQELNIPNFCTLTIFWNHLFFNYNCHEIYQFFVFLSLMLVYFPSVWIIIINFISFYCFYSNPCKIR